MVGHGGSSSLYLADPTSPIPSHCASIVVTNTLRVNTTELTHTSICLEERDSLHPENLYIPPLLDEPKRLVLGCGWLPAPAPPPPKGVNILVFRSNSPGNSKCKQLYAELLAINEIFLHMQISL